MPEITPNKPPMLYNIGGLTSPLILDSPYLLNNSGIDTLEIGYRIEVTSEADSEYLDNFWEMLSDQKKIAATEAGRVLPFTHFEYPDLLFVISGSGLAPYSYLVKCDLFHVRFFANWREEHIPPVHIRLTAYGLALYGLSGLLDIVSAVIGPHITLCNDVISRVDLFADFQGYDFTSDDIDCFKSPANWRPVYPSVSNPETFYFGKGALCMRIYNKSVQSAAKDVLWVRQTWNFLRLDSDVWRCEIQFRREKLRDFSVNTVAELCAAAAGLVAFGLNWTVHRSKARSNNHDKISVSPLWLWLREVWAVGSDVLDSTKNISEFADLERIAQSINGLLVSAGVAINTCDFDRLWNHICFQYIEKMHAEKPFEQRVSERMWQAVG